MLWFITFWVFCCLQVLIVFADYIGEDYFYEKPLRSLTANVDDCNSLKKMYCNYKCENNDGTCLKDKCYCIYEPKVNANEGRSLVPSTKAPVINEPDYTENNLVLQHELRHHIAHFCPNLDEARKCIRKCMKEGKPAFCGKDHVCYCGHRYSYHQKEKKVDPAKINTQFYDLYEKYFGPDTTVMEKSKPAVREPIQISFYSNKHKVLLK